MLFSNNGLFEDLGAIVGATGAIRLAVLFGGANFYVPNNPHPDHQIAKIVGLPAMKRLCDEFGGQTISLPGMDEFTRARRVRSVAKMIRVGLTVRDIGLCLGMTTRAAQYYCEWAKELGLVGGKA